MRQIPGDIPEGMVNEVVAVLLVPGGSGGTDLVASKIAPESSVTVLEKKKLVVDAAAPPDPMLLMVSVILILAPALAAPGMVKEEITRSGLVLCSVIDVPKGIDGFLQASAN